MNNLIRHGSAVVFPDPIFNKIKGLGGSPNGTRTRVEQVLGDITN